MTKYVGSCEDLSVANFNRDKLGMQKSMVTDRVDEGACWEYQKMCRYHPPTDIEEIADAIIMERSTR